MTISSKDTLETAAPPAKSTAPAAPPPKPDTARLRADAVSLDVPVRVHGSRVTDVVMGTTPHTEPFEEETSTMIVFPHGGVLRMVTAVTVGQMLVLTNLKSKQDAICRVVKVRAYSNTQAYVEVEFTHRMFGYWGVHFASEDEELPEPIPAAPKVEAAPVAPPVEARKPEPPVISSVSVKVEDLPKPFTPPARPESPFASIGSKEDVQVAATTLESPTIATPAPARQAVVPPPPAPVPMSRPSPIPSPLDEITEEAPSPSRSFGTLSGGTLSSASTSDMGTRLGRGFSESAPRASSSSKGLLIAACAAFLVVGVALGAWYFRQHPAGSQKPEPQPVAESPAASAPAPSSFPETQNLPPANSSVVASAVSEASAPPVQAPNANPTRPTVTTRGASDIGPHVVGEEVPQAAAAKSAPMGNIGVAVLGAHPVTTAKKNGNVAAPEIPSVPSAALLPGIAANSPNLAPPPSGPKRIRVGGVLVPAKLAKSNPPVYPAAARQTGIEGDVVVAAQIDEHGNVTGVQAVSGLGILRQAALDAVKTWKYQPATLDGDAVSSQINVTVQFRK